MSVSYTHLDVYKRQYLTPAPHRGERNESAYVRFVCEKVAELKGLPLSLIHI